jgi:anaerobic selenocysteine-containing dehydrogenase
LKEQTRDPKPLDQMLLKEPDDRELAAYPHPDQWDDWTEYDARAWPKRVERHYTLVPTVCFNCEAACGLLAYVDKDTGQIQKLEGNPAHPASRGRNCAKGPATINQVNDPERILYPLRRVGPRGSGKWERVSWDAILDDIAGRMRAAITAGRRNGIMYHVGRPGEDGYMDRVLAAWGVDGHNSHTNVCSASARAGYAFWMGMDRPSPDHANSRFMLLLSAHLEAGHYFNPHAQRIIEGKMAGAKIAVMDPRLSNTAAMADYWMPTIPGSESAVLLAIARILLIEGWIDREFLRRWVNWEEFMRAERPQLEPTFANFLGELTHLYDAYTPEFAALESGIDSRQIVEVAAEVGRAGSALATHIWRGAAAGNEGGWQVARCLFLLNVLTGSVGTPGGTSPNWWDKFIPVPFKRPAPQKEWNELEWPREYPLAHHEMSFLLPHFLKEGRGALDVYFTRVYNPVWTNPDGFVWIDVLKDESKVGLHAALTPTWNETAYFADYVLPMGHAPERHDTHSYESHAATWLGFRQPVQRVVREKLGQPVEFTYQANPGEVWEESEFWIELSWRLDPDGALGIRPQFESPYRPGEKVTVNEYYQWMFEHSVPGLPEAAAKEGLTPLGYMRKYGAFQIRERVYREHESELTATEIEGTQTDPVTGVITTTAPLKPTSANPTIGGAPPGAPRPIGVMVDGRPMVGFNTPSRKCEFYSGTLKAWGWPEQAIPGYARSHVHPANLDRQRGECVLLPTFRLPTMIHTRSGNAKWLTELSHGNPLWIHTEHAAALGLKTGDLVRVNTDIGYFVVRTWVTEAIRPGIVACSHHMGRWRLDPVSGTDRWNSALVEMSQPRPGTWRIRQVEGVTAFPSDDPDSARVWWGDAGVHQNITFPVHPDPVSGQHAWHQKVRVEHAQPEDRYGDIVVDTEKSMAIFREWLNRARPTPGPGGLRRPPWLFRPLRPAPEAYRL